MEVTIFYLRRLAKGAKWNEMDLILPQVCNRTPYQDWAAHRGIKDKDECERHNKIRASSCS